MALLMTPTLWDSIDWLNKSPDSWKARAYQGLLDMLNRKWAPTKAIERGIAFEKQICHGTNPISEVAPDIKEKFQKAYDMIHAPGHDFQAKAKKIVEVDTGNGEKEFCLYGKLDVDFKSTAEYPDGLIIDIKTTGSWKGKASYLSKWQHKVYCWLKRVKDFKYIVFEFGDSGMLIDIHFIDYHVDDFVELGKELMEKLVSVIKFLQADKKLAKAYMEKFNLYN